MKLNDLTSRPTIYLAIGASGSGKSTYLNKLRVDNPEKTILLYSWDDLRHRWYDSVDYGNAYRLSSLDNQFKTKAREQFEVMLETRQDIYVDNTNLTVERRSYYIKEAKLHGYRTVGIEMPVNIETILARQHTRDDKTIKADVVIEQFNKLQRPAPNEFDEVIISNHNITDKQYYPSKGIAMLTFKQWLTEVSTIPQLDMKARQAFPHTKKRQNDMGSVATQPGMFFKPNIQNGELTIDARSRSTNGNMHTQRIILYKVNFVQPDDATGVPISDTGVAMEPKQLTTDTSRVNCDCMDFRFRFADHNHQDDSLAGNPPPQYIPVPGSNRGPANPKMLPGLCKHLMKLVQTLKQQKLVR